MNKRVIYQLDGRPKLTEAIPLGLQHILAMFVGNVTPLIIISNVLNLDDATKASLIQCAMFVSGIVTLMQCYPLGPIGAKLPIVMGTSFGFVPAATAIGVKYGIEGILGACLVGALFQILVGGLVLKRIRKYFPPVVTGIVVLTMGIALLPTGVNYFAGGVGAADFASLSNLFLGTIVLITVIFFKQYTKGMLSISSVLIGLIVGYLVAIPMGKIDFSSLSQAAFISIPMPFQLGFSFHMDAIIAMIFVYMVSTVETIGDTTAIANSGLGREASEKEIVGAVLADGIGSFIGAIFNVLPNTSFGQNVGIVAMTKIVNRFVVATGAFILIISGIFPKVGALISLMPASVLGGASIVMFSMIVVSGIRLITTDKLTERNAMIIAVSLGLGLGVAYVPGFFDAFPESIQLIFGESKTVLPAILAVILNMVLPKEEMCEENALTA
ncbi:uracil-xanthine permease family protein [Terrisporobacter mayombei]|uniref:Nucleobase transporter PlUacP n=1 Tax=Terrisporobacter mayombei TaxID=1541 RepID=A0ABY9Q0S8_9FIRM|nr:nucleobase:cation symporter-2 family protein [Terrisporobacter mayombei]MCC3866848.1 purine permease [Terrisporobacter mayombei]WMT81088.1 Nucleobase transporter PlUacP [Terrisporobacter mayombei]